jgi:hypothetical protein
MFPYWMQNATRIEIYGTEGMMIVGRHGGGWQVFVRPQNRQPVVKDQMYGRFPDPEHKENFIQCIRSRQKPNADVLEGHRSTLMIHYANISYRLGGQKLTIDPQTEQIVDNPEAMQMFKRTYRQPWVVMQQVSQCLSGIFGMHDGTPALGRRFAPSRGVVNRCLSF